LAGGRIWNKKTGSVFLLIICINEMIFLPVNKGDLLKMANIHGYRTVLMKISLKLNIKYLKTAVYSNL
jgi:hypothetical protein